MLNTCGLYDYIKKYYIIEEYTCTPIIMSRSRNSDNVLRNRGKLYLDYIRKELEKNKEAQDRKRYSEKMDVLELQEREEFYMKQRELLNKIHKKEEKLNKLKQQFADNYLKHDFEDDNFNPDVLMQDDDDEEQEALDAILREQLGK